MSRTLLVITTYNQSEYTKACFESLRDIEDDVDVLVIDDCSTDDTIELCKEYNHEVIVKEKAIMWILAFSDGTNSLSDISKRSKIDFSILKDVSQLLLENKLIKNFNI